MTQENTTRRNTTSQPQRKVTTRNNIQQQEDDNITPKKGKKRHKITQMHSKRRNPPYQVIFQYSTKRQERSFHDTTQHKITSERERKKT